VALDKCRREALSSITGDRLFVERMAQRQRHASDNVDAMRDRILKELDKITVDAKNTNGIDELDDLTDDAELQGLFAAYLCPVAEIKIEGDLVLDQIEGWGIPKSSTETVRKIWKRRLRTSKPNLRTKPKFNRHEALYTHCLLKGMHGATSLMTLTKKRLRCGYFPSSLLVPSLLLCLRCTLRMFSFLLMLGILAAGAAGSCASVMLKRPTIEDRLSRKVDVSGGRV
jgi:hypothetical protein